MRVVFAPDYRSGTPYQLLLAVALEEEGVEVGFLEHYYRGLPLTRGLAKIGADLFHLHWPEHYWHPSYRWLKYGDDLLFATRGRPLILTAHNFQIHDQRQSWKAFIGQCWTYYLASSVLVHSAAAAETLLRTYPLEERRLHLIPHGNEAAAYPEPSQQHRAREKIGLPFPPERRLALMFGAIRPYKGQEAVIDWWKQNAPPNTTLAIVGQTWDQGYRQEIRRLVKDCPTIHLVDQHQNEADTALWLSAADAALFNYRQIFSSGSMSLALGFGLPLLYPSRNTTVDLEPFSSRHPGRVNPFYSLAGDFGEKLSAALQLGRCDQAASDWATERSWQNIARKSIKIYKSLL